MRSNCLLVLIVGLLAVSTVAAEEKPSSPNRDYRGAMRQFVQAISEQGKRADAKFLVVPQGGLSLLLADSSAEEDGEKPATEYLKAIDGVGQEEIFYGYDNKDNRKTPPRETKFFLQHLKVAKGAGKTILSIDYARKQDLADDAYAKNEAEGFIPFVADRRGLDDIPAYPPQSVNENTNEVTSLADVKNFLYLIDDGKFKSKAKFLAALSKTNHDLLVIDLFAGDESATPADLQALQRKANGGRRLVLCYMSIGEAEDYRLYWQPDWKLGNPTFLGHEDPQWKGNFAVKYWQPDWQALFVGGPESYLARIQAAGFDGVYLDKVDEYEWFEEHGE